VYLLLQIRENREQPFAVRNAISQQGAFGFAHVQVTAFGTLEMTHYDPGRVSNGIGWSSRTGQPGMAAAQEIEEGRALMKPVSLCRSRPRWTPAEVLVAAREGAAHGLWMGGGRPPMRDTRRMMTRGESARQT
jgi:hypothetical protein